MTVEKAREVLGKEIKHLTDKRVEEFIRNSSALIEVILDLFETRKYARNK